MVGLTLIAGLHVCICAYLHMNVWCAADCDAVSRRWRSGGDDGVCKGKLTHYFFHGPVICFLCCSCWTCSRGYSSIHPSQDPAAAAVAAVASVAISVLLRLELLLLVLLLLLLLSILKEFFSLSGMSAVLL